MEEFKEKLNLISEKLATHDSKILKMEITIHGSEGRGGLYDKVDDMNDSLKSLQKSYWIGMGALMIVQVVIIPLIFKFML